VKTASREDKIKVTIYTKKDQNKKTDKYKKPINRRII